MTSSPLIPRAVIRCASLSHDGAVPPAEPGFRVVAQGPEVEPVIPVQAEPKPSPKRHRALVLFGAVATITVALVGASALGDKRGATNATQSEPAVLIPEGVAAENDDDYRPLTLSLGWDPKADAPQTTPAVPPAPAKPRWRAPKNRRGAAMKSFRKVDDPKPNPYE